MKKSVMIWIASAFLVLFLIRMDRPVAAQNGSSTERMRRVPSLGAETGHTTMEIALSVGVLLFGAVIVFLEVLVMLKRAMYWEIWSFKILGLTLVIIAGLFLIVAGYSQNQAAPMMGLLGTVAGYLLGKEGSFAPPPPPRDGQPTSSQPIT